MQHQADPVVSKSVALGTDTENHLENFERFFQDLNKAAKSILPRVSRKYSGVVVLLIRWEHDDLDTETEINDLEQLFRNAYHYRTERYLIPSIDSTTELEQRLLSFRTTYDTGDNLLLLYYGGHGSLEPGKQNAGRSVWHARANGPEKLVWSNLQGVLERAKSDVVFILDCCYASSATTSAGSKEGLWACNSGLPITCVDDNSFTRHLIEELKTLSTSSLINIAMLHARLMRHVGKPGSPTLLKEPWYTNMGEVALPSAEITPQPQLSTLDNCLKVDKEMTETLALLAVRLQDATSAPSVLSWQNWCFDLASDDVESVHALGRLRLRELTKLEALFDGYPALALVSMPIFVWDRLPENPSYTFIGFINSANMLHPSSNPQAESHRNGKMKQED
ncbi:MAG: hypothetical protein Q9162_000772 [Coniocarpon cinnabarinum]